MDFSKDFAECFGKTHDYESPDISLGKKLQDTRHALQESQSEVTQLKVIIGQLYSEARVENVATSEVVIQMKHQLFKNIPLPRNADSLPLNEQAGFALYYMKFLGFAARKAAEEFHTAKEHLEGIHKSISSNTIEVVVDRTGEIRVPELDGKKELKRSEEAESLGASSTTLTEEAEEVVEENIESEINDSQSKLGEKKKISVPKSPTLAKKGKK